MSPKRRRRPQQGKRVVLPQLDPQTPVGKYRAFKTRQISAQLDKSQAMFDFPFDDFQIVGCQVLDGGADVLVTAPTSAGKTIVRLYGILLALRQSKRLSYTTPIKALSNQKFLELQQIFGSDSVGLSTGDMVINGGADIIVMTAEVLHNMTYAKADLSALGFVVMDEVHYLSDQLRDPVWEEITIHLDPAVRLVYLSATVPNSRQFADWLETLRGPTKVVSTSTHPVPLEHLMVNHDAEIFPLFENQKTRGNLNQALLAEAAQLPMKRRGCFSCRQHANRVEITRRLQREGLLPAIQFIFSRVGCDTAATEAQRSGLRLTSEVEAKIIRRRVEATLMGFNPKDLSASNIYAWEGNLVAGIASHHVGLLPIQKQLVENLFADGLVCLVLATETLALGINMPVRAVVLEALNKFSGSERMNLTAGEYTQLTGRAGRRGIDTLGHTLTISDTRNPPQILTSLAAGQSFPLHSAFAPNYNVAVNLLAGTSFDGAQRTVEKSFAQFEALGSSRKLLKNLNSFEAQARKQRETATCHEGDIFELLDLMKALSTAEKQAKQRHHSGENIPGSRAKDRELVDRTCEQVKAHPCYRCSDHDIHLSHARQYHQASNQAAQLRQRIEMCTKSSSRQLRSTVKVLQALDYVQADYRLTPKRVMLQGVYNERDLLVVECVQRGPFTDLTVSKLAGALAIYISENRGEGPSRLIPTNASLRLTTALEAMARLNFGLTQLQEPHLLEPYQPLDTDKALSAVAQAQGKTLTERLGLGGGVGAGDFVRMVHQVIDLSNQLRQVVEPGSSQRFQQLNDTLRRGVVAWDF